MTTATATKERPILFSGPMVRAILDGKKTQTRRVAKFKPLVPGLNLSFSGLEADDQGRNGWALASRDGRGTWNERTELLRCPYGQVGDRLWVKETWHHEDTSCADHKCGQPTHIYHKATEVYPGSIRWRPSIFMQRWASRITLEVAYVRVERLQRITEEDAKAEGVDDKAPGYLSSRFPGKPHSAQFALLWESINAKRGKTWESNPWVWVVDFRRVS